MCSIFGWLNELSKEDRSYIVHRGNERGRDGWGIWSDGQELRGLNGIVPVPDGIKVVGNFRATPTTEAISDINLLQPYNGIVHNGIIANDKEFGNYAIDSMTLPIILSDRTFEKVLPHIQKIKGSYALAYFDTDNLILACNYKPIYYAIKVKSFMFASTPDMLPYYSTPVLPYSVMSISPDLEIRTIEIPRKQNKKVLVSCSGGLDSTTVAYMLKNQGYDVTLIHFTYGCLAEQKEIDRVYRIADDGDFDLKILDMPRNVMTGTLTNGNYHKSEIGGAEYAFDWISARNLLMLSIMTAYAETNNFGYIAFGGNLEESGAYPDNEQEFGRRFNAILPYAVQNGIKIELLQPVATYMKHEIVKIGLALNVPYELTWSCYGSGDKHCNNCGPCFMRKMAFERNGRKDPVFD